MTITKLKDEDDLVLLDRYNKLIYEEGGIWKSWGGSIVWELIRLILSLIILIFLFYFMAIINFSLFFALLLLLMAVLLMDNSRKKYGSEFEIIRKELQRRKLL